MGNTPGLAHDFWIEPADFHLAGPGELRVGLRVGENFQGDAVKRNPEKIRQFVLLGAKGEKPVEGEADADPAGTVRIDLPDLYVIGYRSSDARIELPPGEFSDYLKEEGLERIITLRADRGESDKAGRERYSRCAKALVACGRGAPRGYERKLGFPLELVPMKNPYAMEVGQDIRFQLLHKGEPLLGARVAAVLRGSPEGESGPQIAVTNAEGIVNFTLDRAGVWLIKSVHMVPLEGDSDADWESLWATLTFELPVKPITRK